MSYYTVEVNEINVIGTIWMPAITCAQNIKLDRHDLETIKQYCNGELNREGIEDWLGCHTGDFQYIQDFRIDIGDFLSNWNDPDSEYIFSDCMYPEME